MTPPDDVPDGPARDSGARRDIARTLDPDYDAILSAVTETARGRWFLTEYARRNRTADTRTLLTALNRLEKTIARAPRAPAVDVSPHLADLLETIRRARIEIAAVPRYGEDGAVRRGADVIDFLAESEPGKAAIAQTHEAAERIQEVVWNLREHNVSSDLCDTIDRNAIDIQAACREATVTFKGMNAMGRALRQLEIRVNDLIGSLAARAAEAREAEKEPDIFADDPAVGRFLEDIEIIDVVDVDWHARYEEIATQNGADEADAKTGADVDDDIFEDAAEPRQEPEGLDFEEPGAVAALPAPGAATDDVARDSAEAEAPPVVEAAPAEVSIEAAAEPAAATDEPATPIRPDAAAITKAAPAAQGKSDRPVDLTGLTFDQKMILFS
jgi:chemotaxis protein CheZ